MMDAGRELDTLIAEKVMGYHRATESEPYWNSLAVWVEENGERWEQIPDYSTDIAAAWQVVEHLHGRVVIDHWSRGAYKVMIYLPAKPPSVEASAESAPLAICRAALAALSRSSAASDAEAQEQP